MSLPTRIMPKYDLTLPGSGKSIKYRPFIVKEQKVLLTAVEMDDSGQLNNAVRDIIESCTFGELDIDSLPIYDIEYLMLNIRKHSVGEVIELNYACNKEIDGKPCGGKMVSFLNITDVQVDFPEEHKYDLIMTDNMGMKLKDLNYKLFNKIVKANDETINSTVETIIECIESIYDIDGVYLTKDYTTEELTTWIDQLSLSDFEQIETFLNTMPSLKHTIKLKCPKCGNLHETELEGLDDFLD